MGFTTTVFFLNDFWSDISKDPEGTVRFIGDAMNDGGQSRNYITVLRSEHADFFRLFCTWHGQIIELNKYDDSLRRHLERPGGREYVAAVVREAQRRINQIDALLVDN